MRQNGVLYVVPTPIGNIRDISLRALDVLTMVDMIAAEDPHVTGKLLRHYEIATESISCSEKQDEIDAVLRELRGGKQVALVCDVGTPTIADPGAKLIAAALADGHTVTALPGPVAAVVAVSVSGFGANRIAFDGFPPRRRTDRAAFFALLAAEHRTIVLYESPRYLKSTLACLLDHLGPERQIVLLSALTTPQERIWRGDLTAALAYADSRSIRGSLTLVVSGCPQ